MPARNAQSPEYPVEITADMIDRAADELWFYTEVEDAGVRKLIARDILKAAFHGPIDHDAWLKSDPA